MQENRVIVVGGGITGLAAAWHMKQLGMEAVLVERGRLGGKIASLREHGFVIEGGADSFLSTKPGGTQLCAELGMLDRLEGIGETAGPTFVVHRETLHRMPEGLTGLVPSRLEPLLESPLFSKEGKNRLRQELDIPASERDGDESLAAFVARRFGREVYDRLIEPLMGGIYAGDGERLSLAATFPQLRRLEVDYGSLLRGIQAASSGSQAQEDTKKLPAFLTPITGMSEIVEHLSSQLKGTRVVTGNAVSRVASAGAGFSVTLEDGAVETAEAVILAVPAPTAGVLIEAIDPELRDLLHSIPYVASATVSLAFRESDLLETLEGRGFIVPRSERRRILACTFVSRKFAGRAPRGFVLLRAFVGRAGQEEDVDRDDRDLLDLVRTELAELASIRAEPVLSRVFRWPQAMPQYNLGHLDRLGNIESRLEAHPGLFLAGHAYRGVGIPDCIQSGRQAATQAASWVSARE